MKPHELPSVIRRTGLARLYLVLGEEAYLRDQAVTTLRSALFREGGQGSQTVGTNASGHSEPVFNHDVLYADETDASEILVHAREASFFTATRLVIVKWIEKLPTREGDALIPYFTDPTDSTVLVLVGTKLDGRSKWVQVLKRQAVVVDCAPLYETQRAAWVKRQAADMGLHLDEPALARLKESAETGLYVAKGEMDKLASYLPAGQPVTDREVEALQGREPGVSVFELAEALGAGDRGRALWIIAKNLEAGEAPLRIFGALVWQVRRIWKAKSLMALGHSEAQTARAVGIPPFRAKAFCQHIHQWTDRQCRLAWDLFCTSDSALKGGSASPRRVLDQLVFALCVPGSPGRSHRSGPSPLVAQNSVTHKPPRPTTPRAGHPRNHR